MIWALDFWALIIRSGWEKNYFILTVEHGNCLLYTSICREWAKRGSMSFPFTSMTGGVTLTTNYAGNASMGAGRASGRLWLTALIIYPNEPRKRRNTQNEFWIYDDRHTTAALYAISQSIDRVSSQQHRKGHVLPDVRRYTIQRAGGRERNPVCLLPCHSHCRSPCLLYTSRCV